MIKNILILDTGKEWGGGTNSLLELLKRIDNSAFNFTVLFYSNYKKGNESDIKREIEKLGISFIQLKQPARTLSEKILKETGRALLFFSTKLKKEYIFRINYHFRIKKNVHEIKSIIKDNNFDLIYMNNQPSTNLEGIIAAKETGIKSILHSRIETDLNSYEISKTNKCLSRMICVSEGVRDSFIKQGIDSSKCVVIHNGIDRSTEIKLPPEIIKEELGIKDELIIGTVGSLIKRKQISDLVDAILIITSKKKFSAIKCVIVGEGPERAFLRNRANQNGLDKIIFFTGFMANAVDYINAFDIFILPSEREGLPRVILEAMLMAKPVIATNIAGPAELVLEKETGLLYQTGNVVELARCITELLSSHQLRSNMGQAGRNRVINDFSIDKYINNVSNTLSEVLG